MIAVIQRRLTIGHRVRPGTKLITKYITIHSTGNPTSVADSERRWLDNPDNKREASWHYCIDEKECIEAIPPTEIAWHAGSGNKESIGIEICESGDRKRTLERAAEFVAQLLKQYGLGVEALRRHYDWTKKSCPSIMMANNWAGWNDFKKQVQEYLDHQNKTIIKIDVDGTVMEFQGFILEGITYIQLRELGEKTGYYKVDYNKIPIINKIY